MAETDFDAIVVGSGCAGPIAAYELAKAGKSVLVIERGEYAGAKNMTGGRVYSHSLKKVFPHFEEEAPIERRVVSERVSFLSPDSNFTAEFRSQDMLFEGSDSFTVLRAPFDQWLAEKAEDAGAEYIYGIAVEELIKEDGRVRGVRAGDDEITAEIVILCDGVNSLLTKQAVGFNTPDPSTLAVGIKQVIELPASVITDRFMTSSDDEGSAWLLVGDGTHGHIGGAFIYANKESVSLGLVATMSDLTRAKTPVYQMLEDLKNHPDIAPLIRGGKVVEHSGHMVPEGGYNMMPELIADGVILAGESAMMCVSIGYLVRGIDYAIAAGMHAGQSAVKALDAQDTTKAGLKCYVDALENSFVLKDLRQFSKFPHFMETATRLYSEYPVLVKDVFNGMFLVDGEPGKPLKQTLMSAVKKVGIMNVARDLRGGMKAL